MELMTSYHATCANCGYEYYTLDADQRCGRCGSRTNVVDESADIMVED